MTYAEIRVTDLVYDVAARCRGVLRICRACERPRTYPEYTDLVVEVKQHITQGALDVFCLPYLLIGPALESILQARAHDWIHLNEVRLRNGTRFQYQQLRCTHRLALSLLCYQPGSACPRCGQASLNLSPIILKPRRRNLPPVAQLRESPAIYLLRDDIAQECRAAGIDIDLQPVFFEGETIPDPGPTFSEGAGWGDL